MFIVISIKCVNTTGLVLAFMNMGMSRLEQHPQMHIYLLMLTETRTAYCANVPQACKH